MEFVIGGAWQGKEKEACRIFHIKKEDILDGRSCTFEDIYRSKGISHFEELIRRMLKEEKPVENLAEDIARRNPHIIIISREVGYGIVPMEPFERLWREQTGRISCEIAKRSSRVIRVVAGISVVIKGEPV